MLKVPYWGTISPVSIKIDIDCEGRVVITCPILVDPIALFKLVGIGIEFNWPVITIGGVVDVVVVVVVVVVVFEPVVGVPPTVESSPPNVPPTSLETSAACKEKFGLLILHHPTLSWSILNWASWISTNTDVLYDHLPYCKL